MARTGFVRDLGAWDATMIVAGSMIGSGIFIVSADIARQTGSAGWLLGTWIITGALTITAAVCYGELTAMMPRAGGQYVYLREAWSPMFGFLYGWTMFLVVQTGTVAAVAVGFARYLGVLIGRNAPALAKNFSGAWTPGSPAAIVPDLSFVPATSASAGIFGLLVALCVAQVGSLFSVDAWNNVTFVGGEVKNPRRTIAFALAAGDEAEEAS